MTFLVLIFYLFLNVSYFLSPYQDYPLAKEWIGNYWKFIVLYFLILFSINDMKDIFYIFTGLVLILFLYQAHSWNDFLHGGSYVWQQGIRRIVGIWSEGIGAANYFGVVTLYSLPFALFWFKSADRKSIKVMMTFYFFISLLSIVYSGTRGAMLGVIFFILINIRTLKHVKIAIVVFAIASSLSVLALPDYLKHRYFRFIPLISEKTYHMSYTIEEEQKKSALARLSGLIDGWELAKRKPIFGYGPGSSPVARKKVNEELYYNKEYDYGMHNLYGQVLSETGFSGTILFFLIIFKYFYQFRSIKNIAENDAQLSNYRLVLQNSMLLLLFYGVASHTLFRYNWLILFACHSAFFDIVSKSFKQKISEKQSA